MFKSCGYIQLFINFHLALLPRKLININIDVTFVTIHRENCLMSCYATYSYLTELWDNPFAGHLPYCSCAIIDKRLCQLDCGLCIVKKYITVFYMLYILGVHISACCFICNFPGANKEITLFGHRQSCLISFCGESTSFFVAT